VLRGQDLLVGRKGEYAQSGFSAWPAIRNCRSGQGRIGDASGDMSGLRASLGERGLEVEGLWVDDRRVGASEMKQEANHM